MKKKSGHLIWLIIYPLILCCCWLNTMAYARSVRNISLTGQYALSRVLGNDHPEYHARSQNTNIILSNQNQEFTVKLYDDAGLVLQHQNHHISMRLVAVGAGGYLQNLSSIQAKVLANQISYDQGLVKQWFVNGPMGLQQGFTINKRPGKNKTGNLVLTLDVDSDLQPRPAAASRGVDFVTTDEEVVLQYTGLMVVDADTRQLPAHIETHRNQIDIVVDDSKAVYPVMVDPIFQQAKLTANDGAGNDEFGSSVAIDGNIVVVGAPGNTVGGNNNQGAVYVFRKSGGNWKNLTQIAKLTADDGNAGNYFGTSVAISKDTIVAGSPQAFVNINSHRIRAGAAYVFVKPATGWEDKTQTKKLAADDAVDSDLFGYSVDITENTIVVGSPYSDIGSTVNQGAVYVFDKPDSGWINATQNAKLTADDGAENNRLGWSVACDNKTVVAGAYNHDVSGHRHQGTAYVFVKPVSGWTNTFQKARLTADDGLPWDRLGKSVAISGNVIIAGADEAAQNGKSNTGLVYLFVKPFSGWADAAQTARLTAADAVEEDHFGHAVAIDGNTIVVGSPYHNHSGTAGNGLPFYVHDMGAVYTFSRPSGGWHDLQTKAAMISSDGQANDHLGKSVAISGSTIVAGAPDQDLSGKTDQGAAYVFNYKKENPWPMFISAVTSHVGYLIAGNKACGHPTTGSTSTHRLYIGSFGLNYKNKDIPHYSWDSLSFCYIKMPVIGDVGQLICNACPNNSVNYDADENNGDTRIRRKGSITFNPFGTCSKSLHSCTVEPHGTGSETIWQWYSTDNGLTWNLVPGMPVTMPINWDNNPIYFNQMDIVHGDIAQTVNVSTGGGEVYSSLNLFPPP